MCYGHDNQLPSLIRQLKQAPWLDVTTFSGSGKDESVGCVTFSNLADIDFIIPGPLLVPIVGILTYLGTKAYNTVPEGEGALCAFYQGTRGGSFTLRTYILEQLPNVLLSKFESSNSLREQNPPSPSPPPPPPPPLTLLSQLKSSTSTQQR